VKIAQVAPLVESIPPSRYGGTERVIAALTSELVAMGHDVTLYATGDSDVNGRLIPLIPRALWKEDRQVNELMVHFSELGHVARDADQYDIVHSHLDFLAFPFARSVCTPFVHTMHGRMDTVELQQLTLEYSEMPLVSISDSQRRPVPRANWVGTVYNGTPVESLPPGNGDGDYLAFVGRISPEKGLAEAIDVAVRAGMRLKIAARMPLENVDNPWVRLDHAYYQDEIKPRLNNPLIEVVGEVDDVHRGELLKDARALLFPINWPEPFGLTMIEALACGTPVIARSLGSVPEIIRDGRTGFACSSIDEMVDACRRIDTLDRAECRSDAEARFSTRAMARGYLAIYRTLCEQRAKSTRPDCADLTSLALGI